MLCTTSTKYLLTLEDAIRAFPASNVEVSIVLPMNEDVPEGFELTKECDNGNIYHKTIATTDGQVTKDIVLFIPD